MSYAFELITRLNAKHQQYRLGRGGTTELTWDAIDGAAARLPQQHWWYLNLCRENARPYELNGLQHWLSCLVIEKIQGDGVRPRKIDIEELGRGLATIALHLSQHRSGDCAGCAGRGFVFEGRPVKPRIIVPFHLRENCGSCDGSGRADLSIPVKIAIAGWDGKFGRGVMGEDSYRKSWQLYERFALGALILLEEQIEQWLILQLELETA